MAPCEYLLAVSVIVKLAGGGGGGGGGGWNFAAINQHCDNLIPREIICNSKIIRIIRSN